MLKVKAPLHVIITSRCYTFQFHFLRVSEHPVELGSFTHTVGAKGYVCKEFGESSSIIITMGMLVSREMFCVGLSGM